LIFDDDWDYLTQVYGPGSESAIGVGPAIRQIVHTWVGALRAKAQRVIDEPPVADKEPTQDDLIAAGSKLEDHL
jgi:hypothetical protein